MGKVISNGNEKFWIESDEEREALEKARDYFQSSKLLVTKGLGYKRNEPQELFYRVRKGRDPDGTRAYLSLEAWKKVLEYASRFDRGERYDSETFVMSEA